MQSWIKEDREFLLWRQNLNVAIAEWKRVNEDTGALLTGAPLDEAKKKMADRFDDLNENEVYYINRCVAEEERRVREHEEREKRHAAERMVLQQQTEVLKKTSEKTIQRSRARAIVAFAVVLLGFAGIVWWQFNQATLRKTNDQLTQKAADATRDGDREAGEKNFDKAIEKYSQAVSFDSSHADAYNGRGRVYLETRQFDEALADFDKAITLKEDNADAYIGRGNVYWQKRDFANALAAYNRAIELKPDLSDAYINRGKVQAEQGNLNRALADYNRAIELARNDPFAFLWRGAAYSKLSDYDRALSDFDQALKLKADLPEAYIKRADALLKRGRAGDSARAVNDYNEGMLPKATYDPETYFNRGEALKNTGQVQLAKADFEKAVQLSQEKPEYSRVKEEASQRLRIINPKPTLTPPPPGPQQANPVINLQYRDQNDLLILARISAELKKQRIFKVAQPELKTQPTDGDVRYFHQEDAASATKVKEIVERTLKDNRIEKTLELKPLFKQGNRPPQGWIEVWLPSLPPPSKNSRRPAENNPYQSRPRAQSQSKEPYSKN
jgi:tetratricopeptide (TPR) repeat protein